MYEEAAQAKDNSSPLTIIQFKHLTERYARDADKAAHPAHPFFQDLAFNTVKNYKHAAKILGEAADTCFPLEYGGQKDQLSSQAAQRIVDEIIADRGPGAARCAVASMGSILSYMILYTSLSTSTHNAFDYVKIPAGKMIGAWTKEQIEEHENCQNWLVRFLTVLLLDTGQRLSDAIKITPRHLLKKDGEDWKVCLSQQKTGKTVVLPVTDRLRKFFQVFASTTESKPYISYLVANPTENNVRYFYQKACEKAGITPLPLHGLRKSAVIRMIESGATVFEVMAVTGHKSVSSLKHYMDGYDQIEAAERAFAKVELRGK
jgi:hypothetical protein